MIFENSIYKKYIKLMEHGFNDVLKPREPNSLYAPIIYFLHPHGKLLRPILFFSCLESLGGNAKKFINQALAIELFHNFTLIHDDIMDNAELRHNKLTVHLKYDVNTAILSGDNLLALSFRKLLTGLTCNSFEIIRLFTEEIITICEGQSIDKDFETSNSVSLKEYFEMISKKTASLIALSCQMGALCAGADRKSVFGFYNYGKNIGIAFQIQDDLLDVIGNKQKFGKKIGSDIVEKKKTYLLLRLYEKVPINLKKDLNKLLAKNKLNSKDVEYVIELYDQFDIINDTRLEIDKYGMRALNYLKKISENKYKDFLIELTNEILNRSH